VSRIRYSNRPASRRAGEYPSVEDSAETNEICKDAERLVDNGIFVAAAGGNIEIFSTIIHAPASAEKVLAVGGLDQDGNWWNSCFGPSHQGTIKPDVAALAKNVNGSDAIIANEYVVKNGTSASTPLVAGLAALMLEKKPSLTALDLKSIICLTSYRTFDTRIIKDNIIGWGSVQGYAALDALENPIMISDTIQVSLDENMSVYCQPITLSAGYHYFELEELGDAEAEMYLFDGNSDENGNPILISHSINKLNDLLMDPYSRMGVYSTTNHDYYLVLKLIHGTGYGSFTINLVIEYRNVVIVALSITSFLGLLYVGKQLIDFNKIYF